MTDVTRPSTPWSDGRQRDRRYNATVTDSLGNRHLLDVYGVAVAQETAPDDWTVTVSGEWSNMLDVAEAIIAADAERSKGSQRAGESRD